MGKIVKSPSTTQPPFTNIYGTCLSMATKGVYAQLAAMGGREITRDTLEEYFTEKKYALKKALDELVSLGYLVQVRTRRDDGKLGEMVWIVIDDPWNAEAEATSAIAHYQNRI